MIQCNECEEKFEFEELKKVKEPHPYGDGVTYETFYYCPHCDSGDLEEI